MVIDPWEVDAECGNYLKGFPLRCPSSASCYDVYECEESQDEYDVP